MVSRTASPGLESRQGRQGQSARTAHSTRPPPPEPHTAGRPPPHLPTESRPADPDAGRVAPPPSCNRVVRELPLSVAASSLPPPAILSGGDGVHFRGCRGTVLARFEPAIPRRREAEVRVVSPSDAPPIIMHFRFSTPLHKRPGALLICRWLESMILKPDGCVRRAKRPKFFDDV